MGLIFWNTIFKDRFYKQVATKEQDVKMISTVFSQVISILVIILIGIYAAKRKILNEEGNRVLISLLLRITIPFLIFNSFLSGKIFEVRANLFSSLYLSILFYAFSIVLSYLLVLPIKGGERMIIHFSNIFPNIAYFGFPLVNLVYGAEGVIYASIYNLLFNIVFWSYGIVIFEKTSSLSTSKPTIAKILLNPNMLAVYLGVAYLYLNFEVPSVIQQSMRMIANTTGPLAMLVIGSSITTISFRNQMLNWKLYYGVLLRLIIIPSVTLFVVNLINLELTQVVKTLLAITAMPTAILIGIVSDKYEYEKEFTMTLVIITTLLIVFTFPLIFYLIEKMQV